MWVYPPRKTGGDVCLDLLDAVWFVKTLVGIQDHSLRSNSIIAMERLMAASLALASVGHREKHLDLLQVRFVLAVEHGQITWIPGAWRAAFQAAGGYFWYLHRK